MHLFDATFLTYLFVPSAECEVENPRARIEDLFGRINGEGGRIIIPSPALAELLTAVGHSQSLILNTFKNSSRFLIANFDLLAAIELAAINREEAKTGNKRGTSGTEARWQKVKFDRQIMAIGKVHKAKIVYSTDGDVRNLASLYKMTPKGIAELPVPYARSRPVEGRLFEEPSN